MMMPLNELLDALLTGWQAMSQLEVIAVLLSALAVWLTVRQNPLCWPLGLVSVLIYAWVFFEYKLYATVGLQLFFAASQIYGWFLWTRKTTDQTQHPVTTLSNRQRLLGFLLAALGGLALGYAMLLWTDNSSPWMDAGLTAFSLLAQIWMAQKRLECWPLWIAVDLLYVGLFLTSGMYLTALLYLVFAVLASIGWRQWQRSPKPALA
jgi:nicotinamide mononucleotide transporter